jgi:hypothetical protein
MPDTKKPEMSCEVEISQVTILLVSIRAARCFFSNQKSGLFSNQKSQFWINFLGLRLENIHKFYGQLDYFMDIWDIL